MAAISVEPQSDIVLCKCPLEEDYKNTFTFSSVNNQASYFSGLTGNKTLSDYTYVRKDNKIRCDIPYDQICNYNYLYYKNDGFTSAKTYYCFIDRIEYVNENCSDIFFHTDVFQTWYFQIVWNRCFVEREHVNDDTIGLHTVPEGLETGEFITNSNPTYIAHYGRNGTDNPATDCVVCLAVTNFADGNGIARRITNGIYNGCLYLITTSTAMNDIADEVKNYINHYASKGTLDYIQSVFMVPRNLLAFPNGQTVYSTETVGGFQYKYISESSSSFRFIDDVSISINTTINGYTPKNKKLFTREFNNIIVSNQAGTDVVMAYEDFTNHTPKFTAVAAICPGCSVKLVPLNYRLLADSETSKRSYNFGIPGPKYPICSWTGDTFTNWLTQNGVNIGLGVIGGAASLGIAASAIATGGATVGLAAMAAGGAGAIGSQLASVYKHSVAPEQTKGNISVGDVTFSDGKSLFTVFQTCIRAEYARIIDEYFSAFGYKINRIKVPNITGRTNWNYIKTIDCNCDGDIPQEDLKEIKKACNHGITFWHNPSHIYDYSQSNSIV